jgi:putative redox protein
MKKATVTWLRRMTFDAESDSHHFVMDARPDLGDDRGPTPTGVMLSALAACTAMDVISILVKKRQKVTGLVIRCEGEQEAEYPHRFTHIGLTYEAVGEGVDPDAVRRAVELSEEKYCSIMATLRRGTEVTTRVEVPAA